MYEHPFFGEVEGGAVCRLYHARPRGASGEHGRGTDGFLMYFLLPSI